MLLRWLWRRYSFPWSHCLLGIMRLNREERGGRCSTLVSWIRTGSRRLSTTSGARVHVRSVFCVDAFLAHGGKLAAFGHEHDDKSDGGTCNQATADAYILELKKMDIPELSGLIWIASFIWEYYWSTLVASTSRKYQSGWRSTSVFTDVFITPFQFSIFQIFILQKWQDTYQMQWHRIKTNNKPKTFLKQFWHCLTLLIWSR